MYTSNKAPSLPIGPLVLKIQTALTSDPCILTSSSNMCFFWAVSKKKDVVVSVEDTGNPLAPPDFKSSYEVLDEVLGEGAYSIVRPAIALKGPDKGEKVAVKIINKAGLSAGDEKDLRTEVSILKRIRHPNIVKLIDFFEEPMTYIIVMEYIEGGELFDRIIAKSYYTEKEARDCVFAMLSAVKYIHDRDVVHRDIKPENLLLKSMSDDADVKVADFGFASEVFGDNLTQQCGTPGYVAPEILAHKPYGKSVDMWSVGVVMYILLGGYPPFHHENQRELYKIIMAGKYEFHEEFWGGVSGDAMELIAGLLTVDPVKRLTVDDALKHPWMHTSVTMLSMRNLGTTKDQLKKYLAKRRFRKAIMAHVAVGRFKKGLFGNKQQSTYSDEPLTEGDEGDQEFYDETH